MESDFGSACLRDGVALAAGAVVDGLEAIRAAVAELPMERAGCRAVRAVLFDKTQETNWGLAWHQDRTLCVVQRLDVEGFGPWSVKSGLSHVAPPFEVLAGMVTVRVHLDDVPVGNAPLLVAPGSRRLGRIAVGSIGEAVKGHGVQACLARAGDIWVSSTPILHVSEAACVPGRRRMLQVDYAVGELPGG